MLHQVGVLFDLEEAYISSDLILEFMVAELFVLPGCDAAEVRVWLPKFQDSLSVLSSGSWTP